jgi:predicted metal-binding membrane protein
VSPASGSWASRWLEHDRSILLIGLAIVIVMAWGWLLAGSGMGPSAMEMTAMAGMDGWLMQPAVWTPGYALLIFAMWWVMMVAMMLPSATPALLLFDRVSRSDKSDASPATRTVPFAIGYVAVWGLFSAVAAAAQWSLESARLLTPMLETPHRWLGAGILAAAGLWQLTPIKAACLRQCRSPLSFLTGHWRDGRVGALHMGVQHGAFCLGCCWFLMLLLFFGGVMNLYWIVGLAIFVLLEKTTRIGHWLTRVSGVGLLVGAAWVATKAA